jgi:hypothetical protein
MKGIRVNSTIFINQVLSSKLIKCRVRTLVAESQGTIEHHLGHYKFIGGYARECVLKREELPERSL